MDEVIMDRKGQILLFSVMVFATFLDGLDGTIVSVVLPEMAVFFNISAASSAWVITSYFTVMTGLVLVFGKMCDYGATRMVLIFGLMTFVVGSLLCGLSVSFSMLIISRILQGIGAAMLASSSVMLAVKYLPRNLLALGLVATTAGESIGSMFGPFLGGMINLYLSWEWIFFINVPIGVVALLIVSRILPRGRYEGIPHFDLKGTVIMMVLVVVGLLTIETVSSEGIDMNTVILLITTVALLHLFIRSCKNAKNPIIDLSIFKHKDLDACVISYTMVVMCGMGCVYIVPFYLSDILGYNTLENGLLMSISGVVTLLMCLKAGKWIINYGYRPFAIFGCVIVLLLSAFLLFVDLSPLPIIIICMVLLGILWGLGDASLASRAINIVPDSQRGTCSTIIVFFGYLAVTIGTAMYAAMFNMGSGSPGKAISELGPDAFMNGFMFTMIFGIVLSIIALIMSIHVRNDPV